MNLYNNKNGYGSKIHNNVSGNRIKINKLKISNLQSFDFQKM